MSVGQRAIWDDCPVTYRSTIRDVAHRAGVSVGTMSNFLNDNKRVAPATRRRIEAAIRDLNFIPNSAVRVVLGGRSHVIALIVPDAANPFFIDVARGVEDVAVREGYLVMLCNTNGISQRVDHYAKVLSEMRVLGAVVTQLTATKDHLGQLESSGASVVLLGSSEEGSDLATVGADDVLGGYLAMSHLLDLGHRDIAFVGGPGGDPQVRDRRTGAVRALNERGLHESALREFNASGSAITHRVAVGELIAAERNLPTGIFCANDLIALAVMSVLADKGIQIPTDVAVVGYDDIDSARLAAVPLTTIRQPPYEIGVAAARILFRGARGEDVSDICASFDPVLIVRASTRSL